MKAARPDRSTVEGRAYLDLQNKARRDGRPFAELLALYTLEGFLARVAQSVHAGNLVLKGGLLLAAFDQRRPTRDADFAARELDNQVPVVTALVQDVARVTLDDGLLFDDASARGVTIREDDQYGGVRVSLRCWLATADTRFHVDVNVGDPISPGPQRVQLPRLLDPTSTIDLDGYPLVMVLAEKIVTALQRGAANTRWRDFADIWSLTRHQAVDGAELHEALTTVGMHRQEPLVALSAALASFDQQSDVQRKWAAWRKKQALEDRLPMSFGEVLNHAFLFSDPALIGATVGQTWQPEPLAWSAA